MEVEDAFGITPLIYAAEKGHVNLVLLYLAQGADVNKVTHSGSTALHYAAKDGWVTCCKVSNPSFLLNCLVRKFQCLVTASVNAM